MTREQERERERERESRKMNSLYFFSIKFLSFKRTRKYS